MGPVRRGPMIRDAVGQFVHDVPSPKPEPFLDSDPLHWIANALLYVASSSSSKRNHNVVGGPSGLCPFCPLRFQPLIPQRLLNPAITQHPSFRVPFSCVAPIFGFSSFAFTPVFCALSRHSQAYVIFPSIDLYPLVTPVSQRGHQRPKKRH